jgi:hypothetical protein
LSVTLSKFSAPPAEDDDDAFVFVDHREEEASIVEYVSEHLAQEDALEVEEDGEQLSVRHRGNSHAIPLKFSPHDRYIMISSLAELLRERYQFFVLKSSLGGDTHGLLVAVHDDVRGWTAVPDHLVPLELGHDYFSGIRVPYLNHEDAAPDFVADREQVADGQAFMRGYLAATMSGKMDAETATKLARLALKDPEARKAYEGDSEAEVAAEIQAAFNEALQSPDVAANRRELNEAMAELKKLTSPSKPWWKFW